jgi:hypothetical protein
MPDEISGMGKTPVCYARMYVSPDEGHGENSFFGDFIDVFFRKKVCSNGNSKIIGIIGSFELFSVDAIGVGERFSICDVDDCTFVGIKSHLLIILPELETIKVMLKLA